MKHRFNRYEGYHEWATRDEYGYYSNGCNYSFAFGYLFELTERFNKDTTKEGIQKNENLWDEYPWTNRQENSCRGIINRHTKRAIISVYNDGGGHSWGMYRSIPDCFNIIYTNHYITNPLICEPNHKLEFDIEHVRFLVENWVQRNALKFKIAQNKVLRNLHSYEFKFNQKELATISKKAKDTKFTGLTARVWSGWTSNETITIERPISLNDILNNRVFTEEEKTLIKQAEFYSKYLYGRGISRKYLINHWNKPVNIDKDKGFNKDFIISHDLTDFTWNECVKSYSKYIIEKYKSDVDKAYITQEENKNRLINKLLGDSKDRVERWRKHKYNLGYIDYDNSQTYLGCTITKSGSFYSITWKPKRLYYWEFSYRTLPYVQLRLSTDGKEVETSMNVHVNLEGGIKRFNTICDHIRKLQDRNELLVQFPYNKIMFGPFSLLKLEYHEKEEGNKQWEIVIGCHHLWMDDIRDFLNYYNITTVNTEGIWD